MTGVLCAGVAVVDFVLQVDQVPPGPGVHTASNASIVGGGCAANAAVAVARLGGAPALIARLGADPVGDLIVADLEAEQVDCSLVARHQDRRSSYSSVLIDVLGERQILNYRDRLLPIAPHWQSDELPAVAAVLVDTRWPEGSLELLGQIKNVPVVVDAEAPLPPDLTMLKLASHVAFSAQGLTEFASRQDITGTDLIGNLRAAGALLGDVVMVTNGEEGVFWTEKGEVTHCPGFPVDVVDTLGAGDVWHGALALGLGEGQSLEQSVIFASAAAAIKCMEFGGRTGIPDRQHVADFLAGHRPLPKARKLTA